MEGLIIYTNIQKSPNIRKHRTQNNGKRIAAAHSCINLYRMPVIKIIAKIAEGPCSLISRS